MKHLLLVVVIATTSFSASATEHGKAVFRPIKSIKTYWKRRCNTKRVLNILQKRIEEASRLLENGPPEKLRKALAKANTTFEHLNAQSSKPASERKLHFGYGSQLRFHMLSLEWHTLLMAGSLSSFGHSLEKLSVHQKQLELLPSMIHH